MFQFLLLIYISLINIITSRENLIDDVLDDYDIKYEEHLHQFFLNYLEKNNLIKSEQKINQEDIKKIIVDIMLEGLSPDEIEDSILLMYHELSEIYLEKKLKEKKEIYGKDLINIINIKELMKLYYELNGESPIYDDDYIFNDENMNLNLNEYLDNNDFDL